MNIFPFTSWFILPAIIMHWSQMISTLKHRAYLERNPFCLVKEGNHFLEASRPSGVVTSQTVISFMEMEMQYKNLLNRES